MPDSSAPTRAQTATGRMNAAVAPLLFTGLYVNISRSRSSTVCNVFPRTPTCLRDVAAMGGSWPSSQHTSCSALHDDQTVCRDGSSGVDNKCNQHVQWLLTDFILHLLQSACLQGSLRRHIMQCSRRRVSWGAGEGVKTCFNILYKYRATFEGAGSLGPSNSAPPCGTAPGS